MLYSFAYLLELSDGAAVYHLAMQEVASLTNALAHTEWHRFTASNGEDAERRQAAIACFQQCLTIMRVCVGEQHPAAQKVQRELDFCMQSAPP